MQKNSNVNKERRKLKKIVIGRIRSLVHRMSSPIEQNKKKSIDGSYVIVIITKATQNLTIITYSVGDASRAPSSFPPSPCPSPCPVEQGRNIRAVEGESN